MEELKKSPVEGQAKSTPRASDQNLNEKQVRFCQEYIVDLNGTQAAIRAGYSEDSAASIASELLTKPKIQIYVQELFDQRAARTRATADFAISEIFHLISFDPSEVFDEENNCLKDIHRIPKNVRKSIASIEVFEEFSGTGAKNNPKEFVGYTKKVKFWDKPKVVELLAKHLKLLTDKHEMSGPGGVPLAPPQIIFDDGPEDPSQPATRIQPAKPNEQ